MARWYQLVAQLEASGVTRMLLEYSVPLRMDGSAWVLCLDRAHDMILNDKQTRTIERLLGEQQGTSIALTIEVGEPWSETPAARNARLERERHEQAVAALSGDEHVRALVEEFGAELKPESVRSLSDSLPGGVAGEVPDKVPDAPRDEGNKRDVTRGEA